MMRFRLRLTYDSIIDKDETDLCGEICRTAAFLLQGFAAV